MKFRIFIKRVLLLLLICAVFGPQAKGQLEPWPWSLQYVTNMNTLNPAFVGMWDKSGIMVSTRTNWVGITGAALNQYAGYFTPLKNQRSGVAVNVLRKNTGLEKRLSITGDYSHQVRLDWYNYLRFGMRVGIINFDNDLAAYQQYPDRIPDPEFSSDIRFYNMTTFGVGAVFFNEDLYVSLSIPEIISNTFKVNKSDINSSLARANSVYLGGGYVFSLIGDIRFRPNLLVVATVGKPIYADLAGLVYLPLDLQFGINLRSTGDLCLSAQYTFRNGIRVGYASNYAMVSDIRKFQIGTYELIVGYELKTNKRKYTKPSYF